MATILVLMGPAGVGKTTVGRRLAARLGAAFAEGDDFHPAANVEKMRSGEPLDDVDRDAWLTALTRRIDAWRASGTAGVLSCSALKRAYRRRLVEGRPEVDLILLEVEPDELRRRLRTRVGHFMPAELLASQLRTFEPPAPRERVRCVDGSGAPEEVVERILLALPGLAAPPRRP